MTVKRLIGSAPSQVSRNKDLGSMAFQSADAVSITGGLVRGESGAVSCPNGVNTVFTTLPNVPVGCFIVNIGIATGAASTWSSTYLVNTQATSVVITALRQGSAGGFGISNSGLTLSAVQSSGGGPFDIVWSTLRIL